MSDYAHKSRNYFTGTRLDLVSLLPTNPQQKVLEIGAGGGDTLCYLKSQGLVAEAVGVELFALPNTHQQDTLIDRFIVADIEKADLDLPEAYFDVIICGDVLEHLLDPWAAVAKITQYLKPQGKLLVSMPNIRDIATLYKIVIKGDFRYDPEGGVLDKTHFRFFCKKNILALLTTPALRPVYACPSFERNPLQHKRRWASRLTLGLFKQFWAVQYLVVAEKQG